MSISLSTLTNPATSDSVLLEAQSEADFLEPIVLFKNRATGSNAISNDATQTTANDQPLSLPLIDGDGYLYLSGVSGNYASVPNESALDITGDIDIRVKATIANLYPTADNEALYSRYSAGVGIALWRRQYNGNLGVVVSGANGSTAFIDAANVTWSEGDTLWFRAVIDVGVGNYDVNLMTSADGSNWTSIHNATVNQTYPVSTDNNDSHFGRGPSNDYFKGAIHNVQVFASTNGTDKRLDVDFTATSIADGASSFDCSTGQTVTINRGSGVDQARIVRRPKAVFNNSEMDFVHTNVGDAFFVCATESGVVSGVFDTGVGRNKFSGNGALKTSYRTDFLQTVWGMWPNTISDSQKKALVDYAKSKSAGKNWAGIENFVFFFRSSNLKSLDASYWDTGSATNFSYFLRGVNTIESLDIRGWDTSSVVNMSLFARACTSLTNISIDGNTLSDSACTDYGNAFTETNLNQATIDDILVRINAAGTSNGTFDRTGGEYPSTTGVAAKNALQARGWSMTFSSEVLPSVLDLEPAAAYSLRALKSSEDPNVVNVRRSSDGALSNFKASEVSDGTLTTWVGEQNLITYSNSFVGNWSLTGSSTLTAGQAGYDGTNDATEFYDSRSNTSYGLFKVISSPINGQINASIYLKAGTVSTGQLDFFYAGGVVRAVSFDLSNGTVEAGVLGGAAQVADAVGITNVGNGWYRVNLTQDYGSTLLNYLRVGLSSAGTIFVQDAQVVEGASVRTYAETNASQSGDGHVTTWNDQREIVETGSAYGTTISGTVDGTIDIYNQHNQIAPAVAGEFYRVRFTASNLTPRGRVRYRNYGANSSISATAGLGSMTYFYANGDYEAYVPSDDGLSLWFTADVGQSFDYSEVSVQQVAEVPNDASQPLVSNMPKIVDGGTLVTEGGKPALDINKTPFDLGATISFGDLSWFVVTKKADSGQTDSIIFDGGTSSTYGGDDVDSKGNPMLQSGIIREDLGNTSVSGGEVNQHLSYYNRNGSNASGGLNGEIKTEATVTTSAFVLSRFFKYSSASVAYDYVGKAQEIVLFNTDQSANRTAIENNINSHFTIYS